MSETVRADVVVVPREPTEEMMLAGERALDKAEIDEEAYTVYKAMIAASPPLRADSDEVRADDLADWFYDNGHEFVVSIDDDVAKALLNDFVILPRRALSQAAPGAAAPHAGSGE